MLGTLVALAVARMPNLETFVWDMPTGILRDCWLALASLNHGPNSKLESVWVRFHDNTDIISTAEVLALTSNTPQSSSNPSLPDADEIHNITDKPSQLDWSYRQVERPNFSILPPLRSLTALNIDEPAYIDEMSILLERSISSLRTLRVGVASTVAEEGFASLRNVNFDFKSTPLGSLTGKSVLEILLSRISNGSASNTRNAIHVPKEINGETKAANASDITAFLSTMSESTLRRSQKPTDGSGQASCSDLASPSTLQADAKPDLACILQDLVTPLGCAVSLHPPGSITGAGVLPQSPAISTAAINEHLYDMSEPASSNTKGQLPSQESYEDTKPCSMHDVSASDNLSASQVPEQRRLKLQELEMEYVHLTPQVLLKTIDWSIVTTLTLLHCRNHDQLWKAFRRAFSPSTAASKLPDSTNAQAKCGSHGYLQHPSSSTSISRSEYRLGLKRLHTNTVSRSLLSFLNETLAPNSLEWLFLQDGGASSSDAQSNGSGSGDPPVSIDSIFRGPLRRHRASISKLMIDIGHGKPGSRMQSQRWGKWKLSREILSFVTSGKMSSLRELAFIVDYKDWVSRSSTEMIGARASAFSPHQILHFFCAAALKREGV